MNKKGTLIFRPLEALGLLFLAWYFLPMMQGYFSANVFQAAFFACFVGCLGGQVILARRRLKLSGLTLTVLCCIAFIGGMAVLGVGDAGKHVRVGLTFFTVYLLYEVGLTSAGRVRVGRWMLAMFLITALTSFIGLLENTNAARTIMHSAADNEEATMAYMRQNIATYSFFQSTVCFVPVLIAVFRRKKWVMELGVAAIGLLMLQASFTIALMIYAIALGLSLAYYAWQQKGYALVVGAIVMCVLAAAFLISGSEILTWLAETINNKFISARLLEIRDLLFLEDRMMTGGLLGRAERYGASLQTFLTHPMGVGPKYSYKALQDGIGYHSQILDDLARYGVVAIVFYVMYFRGYYQLLRREWSKLGEGSVAGLVTVIYILGLTLNIGMRSGQEAGVMFFVLPALPEIVLQARNRRRLRRG